MAVPTCIITGRVAGDSDACGDCDPCSAAHTAPDAVKRLLAEKDEWREKYSDAVSLLDERTQQVADERAAHQVACRMRDEAEAEATRLRAEVAQCAFELGEAANMLQPHYPRIAGIYEEACGRARIAIGLTPCDTPEQTASPAKEG